MNVHIIALAALGKGLSGSDRIFIELSRNLDKRGHRVMIYVWEEGYKMCQRVNLNSKSIVYKLSKLQGRNFGFVFNYLVRIVQGIKIGLTTQLTNTKKTIVYSASDFWMDSIPGWILKKRFSDIIWVGTFYLNAPNPLKGFKEKGNLQMPTLKDTIYYFMQKIPYYLLKNYSDLICLTSEPDVRHFPYHKKSGRYLVVKGGVSIINTNKKKEKKYDAIFQGRFHKQKGVLELVDIWRRVVDKQPEAKLALIGDGPLMKQMRQKVKDRGLEKNVLFLGYLFDGKKKYRIFNQSKIVVHPALYDSGGMAPAEAMAFGLPGISFDLEALKTYYPKGMLKVEPYNLSLFADKILELITDKKMYEKLSKDALNLIKSEWSWEKRTDQFLSKIYELA